MNNKQQGTPMGAQTYIFTAGFSGDSIVDGPGLRCTIFTQGCPHHCAGCHNPATHPFTGGTPYTPIQLFEKIKKFPLCRAVTFSGGEPFCQAEALLPLAKQLKNSGYELAAYSGYTFEQLQQGSLSQKMLLSMLDTLIDGPFIQAQRNLALKFKGSDNQRIIHVQKSLTSHSIVLENTTRWVK